MSQSEIQRYLDRIYAMADLLGLFGEMDEGCVKMSPHTIGAIAGMIKQDVTAIHQILDRS
jgi:hypothetical protein